VAVLIGRNVRRLCHIHCENTRRRYIVAGYSNSLDGNVTGHHGTTEYQDFWIAKMNSSGNLQWPKSLGGTKNDGANAVVATSDWRMYCGRIFRLGRVVM
jgi:hypothetical protein